MQMLYRFETYYHVNNKILQLNLHLAIHIFRESNTK